MFTRYPQVVTRALIFSFLLTSSFLFSAQPASATGLGSQIVCLVFSELNTIGTPIPFLEAEGCPVDSTPVAQCADGINNDADEYTDYPADPGCESAADTTESPNPVSPPPVLPSQCMDGIDNDNDGKTDWHLLSTNGDPGCSSPLDESESDDPPPPPPAAACADGIDNDEDTLIDFPLDLGCSSALDTDETNVPPPPPPPAAACADGIDNDQDTLIDYPLDLGCSDAADTDETNTLPPPPPPSSGGGSGGGSTGGPILGGGILQTTVGQVLGAAIASEPPAECEPYLKTFIKRGAQNSADDVGRLQQFLNQFENASLDVTHVYDVPTFTAVLTFQAKNLGDVLTPWGITAPTGYVYLTTKKKINELYCNATYMLSETEVQEITTYRGAVLGARTGPTAPVSAAKVPASNPQASETDPAVSEVAEVEPPAERRGVFERVRDFFTRLLDR